MRLPFNRNYYPSHYQHRKSRNRNHTDELNYVQQQHMELLPLFLKIGALLHPHPTPELALVIFYEAFLGIYLGLTVSAGLLAIIFTIFLQGQPLLADLCFFVESKAFLPHRVHRGARSFRLAITRYRNQHRRLFECLRDFSADMKDVFEDFHPRRLWYGVTMPVRMMWQMGVGSLMPESYLDELEFQTRRQPDFLSTEELESVAKWELEDARVPADANNLQREWTADHTVYLHERPLSHSD